MQSGQAADGTHGESGLVHIEEVDTAELRIIEIHLRERRLLASDVIAWQRDDGLLVPLGETFLALGFMIDVSAAEGTANGWFLRENQDFSLDVRAGKVTIAGRQLPLAPDVIVSDGVDLFAPASLLGDWFSLSPDWRANTQTLDLSPDYLLPDEERERRSRLSAIDLGAGLPLDTDGMVQLHARPGLISAPFGSVSLTGTVQETPQGITSQANASLSLRGDLAWFTGDLNATASADGARSARLQLSRRDAENGLLGPMRAAEVRLGDISVDSAPLIGRSTTGLGFSIARERLQRGGNFDTTRIEGDALPGWQVELYRDGQLLEFQTVPADGRFVFASVPLLFGANRFSLELYGPSGERETRTRTIDVTDAFLPPGQFDYAIQAVSESHGVFRNYQPQEQFSGGSGFSQETMQIQARAAYGLTPWLTLSGAASRGQAEDGEAVSRLQAGAAMRTGKVLWTTNLAASGEGQAAALGLRSGLGRASLSVTAETYFDGYESPSNGAGENAIGTRFTARLDGRSVNLWEGVRANWSTGYVMTERQNGRQDHTSTVRLGAQLAGISVNNGINWRRSGADVAQDQVDGALSVAGRRYGIRMRASLDYDIRPQSQLRRGRIDISRRSGNFYYGFSYENDMRQDASIYGVNGAYDWNGLRLGLDASHDERSGGTRLQLTLSGDFDSIAGKGLRHGRAARSSRGAALVRVYEDLDHNGAFGPHDRLVPDARVLVSPNGRQEILSDGRILVEDLPLDRPSGIAVDTDALHDPYLTAAGPGISFTGRPGARVSLDLPVIESGEIELALMGEDGTPLEGMIASLIPCGQTRPVMRERAAYDGLVLFQFVPPGCYRVTAPTIEPRQLTLAPGELKKLTDRVVPVLTTHADARGH